MAKRQFLMHNKLLIDVIKRQTGSLHKALTEAVTNSIEAQASKVRIEIGHKAILIEDDGKGFASKKELKYCFETFGSPHTEKEKKVWGQFRMGRGQLFSFGANRWRTGQFQMDVDIEKALQQGSRSNGKIGYDLKEDLPEHAGCTIEIDLYEELDDYAVSRIKREIGDYAKYVSTPVIINGNQINTPPAERKWAIENEDCWLNFSPGERGLAIYNMGVYVHTNYNMGISGTMVSKKRLDVNFARNEVITTCKVWKRIRQLIAKNVNTAILNKSRLADDERAHVISNLLDGLYSARQTTKSPLFPDVTGRYWNSTQIETRYHGKHWTIAPEGSRTGDRIIQLGLGIAFDEKLLQMFAYKGQPRDFFDTIRNNNDITTGLYSENYREPKEMLKGINTEYTMLDDKQITKREKLIISAAASHLHRLGPKRTDYKAAVRHLHVGIADIADAWTNGSSYICISRNFLRKVKGDREYTFMNLAFLLLHELLHDTTDTDSHIHTPEFYHNYHDMTETATNAGSLMLATYRKLVKKEGDTAEPLAYEKRLTEEEQEIGSTAPAPKEKRQKPLQGQSDPDHPMLF